MGQAYTVELQSISAAIQSGGILILLLKAYLGYFPPLWVLPLGWVVQRSAEYLLGYLDEKYLHYRQAENNYTSRQLNPFNEELLTRIKNIESKL